MERPVSLASDPRNCPFLRIRPGSNRPVCPHGECNAAGRDFSSCDGRGSHPGRRPLDLVELRLAAA
eukprot:6189770-Alexandrium_andersonii.AAC.1